MTDITTTLGPVELWDGVSYPAEPYGPRTGIPGVNNTSRWWLYARNGATIANVFWKGNCVRCERDLWVSPDYDLTPYFSSEYLHTSFEYDGVEWNACQYCWDGYGERTMQRATDAYEGDSDDARCFINFEIPEAFTKILEDRQREEAEKYARWVEHVPMVPVEGAVVYLPEEGVTDRFQGWAEDGQAVLQSGKRFPQEKVFTCIPALLNVPHDNIVILSDNGNDGPLNPQERRPFDDCTGVAVRWAYTGHNHGVTVRTKAGRTRTYNADHCALFVPSVNPAKESNRARADRLQYVIDRQQYGLHARLVSEGVNRGWCETFDPILDSQGFQPRRGQYTVSGTITFTHTMKDGINTAVLDEIRAGNVQYIIDYISRASMKAENIQVEQPESKRLLS